MKKDTKSAKTKKTKKAEKEKSSLLKKVLSVLLVLAVLAAVAYIVIDATVDDGRTVAQVVKDAVDRPSDSETVSSAKFSFDAYSDNVFEELNGGLVVVSASAYQVFDNTGEIVGRGTKAFSNPAADSGSGGAVLWSQGGKDVMIVSANGATKAIDSENSVISAAINDSGYVAVAAEQSGYKGLVTVYDPQGEAVYKWFSGSGYLMDAAVNNSNTGMAALTISDNGSRLVAYSFGSEEEQGAYNESENVYFDMGYIAENRICLVSENKAVFVSGKCEYNAEYSFEGWYLKDYSLEGNGYAVFVLGKYRTGGETKIVSVDANGTVKGSWDVSENVSAVNVRGRYIAVTYADKVALYNSSMEEVGCVNDAAGVEKALACTGGKLIAVSANGAVEYDF
ncbi:MAG: hypothetical protein J6S18_00815 [Oscillospiraceae bacterium]|nr:hypothetical protein [Oscillospiraceae bacterium]